MEVIIDTPDELARRGADVIERHLRLKPTAVIGLATGSSPLKIYDELARRHREEGLDFSQATGFMLDEYVGLSATHPERYRNVIEREIASRVNWPSAHVHGPGDELEGGELTFDPVDIAGEYERKIYAAGGVDVQILGVGANGHIAFNEPGSSLASRTRIKSLTHQTRADNARFFDGDVNAVPQYCITQGIGTIMDARHLLLIATGQNKAQAVHHILEDGITTLWPGSVIQQHQRVTVLLDDDAASRLQLADYHREMWGKKPTWQPL
jgi:glucosamine-6-phosphate deaminase